MVRVCISVFVSEVEDKWSNSLNTSAGPVGVPREGEVDGAEQAGSGFSLHPLPPILHLPSNNLSSALSPLFSQIHGQALISTEEEVNGWELRTTLTQLVGLIKRLYCL